MNKKAEAFIKYLDDKKITCFAIEQISEDKLNTVVFRSHIVVEGQRLPTLVILDSCLLCQNGRLEGDMIYTVLDVIIKHLEKEYKKIMQLIWQAN